MESFKEFYGGTSLCFDEEFGQVSSKGKVELKYYKIISEFGGKKSKKQKFGIEVVKKCVDNNVVSEERKEIFNCIEKEEIADRVLEMLKTNKVSPINVMDILEDLSVRKSFLCIR